MSKITPTISVIMPCLNEERSVGRCVESATKSLKSLRSLKEFKGEKNYEVIVVDNGSTDNSMRLAEKAGARVVLEEKKGYGNALMRGIKEAKGEIVVMGDSDGSYDWGEIGRLVEPFLICGSCQELVPSIQAGPVAGFPPASAREKALRAVGSLSTRATRCKTTPSASATRCSSIPDLVIGSRLKGKIESGAMPFLNRYLGTPILNFFLRLFFGIKLSDSQSGFRAFRKKSIKKLNLKSPGMEFASEMLISAKQAGLNIGEVPVTYRRRVGRSKLSPVRDAWRHIRFMLLFSPTWLFLVPGGAIGLIGLISLIGLSFGPMYAFGRFFDIHSMMVASFLTTVGFQISFLGLFAKTYALLYMEQKDKLIEWLFRWFTLEKGLLIGGILGLLGVLGFLGVLGVWVRGGFGPLDAVRPVLLSVTILSLAVQAIFGSFFFALLGSRWER